MNLTDEINYIISTHLSEKQARKILKQACIDTINSDIFPIESKFNSIMFTKYKALLINEVCQNKGIDCTLALENLSDNLINSGK